jgi:hypothetical protein
MQNAYQGGLTSQEITDLLNSDFEFGINFIIDNNPSAVESNISSLSIPLPQNPSHLQLREVIDSILQNGEDPNAIAKFTEILSVPYLNDTPNYTAGFVDYLGDKMPPSPSNASVTVAVIGAIAGIVGVAGNIWSGYKQEDIAEIQQQMLADQYAHEIDKIERTKILGIPQTIFIAIIVFIMFVVFLLFLSRKK